MQTLDDLRTRLDARGQWVRLGVLAAGALAPLIGRWNDLRAAERARSMREEAEARLKGFGAVAPWTRHDVQQRIAAIASKTGDKTLGTRRVSTTIWLAGVGVGLAAAGAGTYLLVRRRLAREAEEPMLDLPAPSVNGNGRGTVPGIQRLRDAIANPPPSAHETVNANAATTATGAESAFDEVRATSAPAGTPPEKVVDPSGGLPGGATSVLPDGAPAAVLNADEAAFIGNIKSMVYHAADDDELPAEENRVYFASEEEARDAGYRRDKDDLGVAEMETQAQASAGE